MLLDTGHFALVEELDAIAAHVDRFLRGLYGPNAPPSVAFGSVS